MDQLDLLFRLIRNNFGILKNDTNFLRTSSVLKTLRGSGSVDCKYRECTIDKEWIEVIEELLPYVEKSIGENRHFIKQFGEVVRIDQVKKVSAASVEHLSRHSNYLTQKTSGKDDLIPEKLYVSEITDNFQLYENRFLYTLLVFLKDFVQTRYNDILSEISASFYEFKFDGDIVSGAETYTLKIDMTEKNPNMHSDSLSLPCSEELLRINAILEVISSLLETTLMKSVAPLSTLTPPITATNIIKKDPNFQLSFRLWDFIMNYSKKGYSFSEKHQIISPVSSETAENLSVILYMISLTTKAEGMSLYPSLSERNNRQSLEIPTEDPNLNELKSRLLLEIEKNEALNRTLNVVTLFNETVGECLQKISSLEKEVSDLSQELDFRKSENTALRIQNGQFREEDHTKEEEFLRLSAERDIFNQYYEEKYSKIKKELRKKYIWNQFKKGKKVNNEKE